MVKNKTTLNNVIKYRTPLYNIDFPLILFWSHKSGCTSFVKWFFFQIGILDKAIQYHPWVHEYENQVYKRQSNYKEEMIEQILQSNKDIFKLVRNPYKRAVSSFLAISQVGVFEMKSNPLYKEWEKIGQYLYDNGNSNEGISFKQFLYYINMVGSDIGKIDPHMAQQYIEGEELFIKNYIHLENFNDHISKIEEKYRLVKSPLSVITKSNHHNDSLMNIIGNYSETRITKEYFSRKSLPTYESFYDKESIGLVKDIFKKDIIMYQYKNI